MKRTNRFYNKPQGIFWVQDRNIEWIYIYIYIYMSSSIYTNNNNKHTKNNSMAIGACKYQHNICLPANSIDRIKNKKPARGRGVRSRVLQIKQGLKVRLQEIDKQKYFYSQTTPQPHKTHDNAIGERGEVQQKQTSSSGLKFERPQE